MSTLTMLKAYPGRRYEIDLYHAVMLVLRACRKVPLGRVTIDLIQSNGKVVRSIKAGCNPTSILFKEKYGISSYYHDSFSIGEGHRKVLPLVGVRLESARIDPRLGAVITLREQKWLT